MKYINFLLATVLVLACTKPDSMPSQISISGKVTNYQNASLDSVQITLVDNGAIGSIPIPENSYYTDKQGEFSFVFSPKNDIPYTLTFKKAHFITNYASIDKKQVSQSFKIVLDSIH